MLILVIGFAVLGASVMNGFAQGRAIQRQKLDADLLIEAGVQSEAFSESFARSRDILRLIAENPAFDALYARPQERLEIIAAGGPYRRRRWHRNPQPESPSSHHSSRALWGVVLVLSTASGLPTR